MSEGSAGPVQVPDDATVTWGEYEIGPLRGTDVEELAVAHCRIWRTTYAALMSADALAGLTPEAFVHPWTDRAQRVELDQPLPGGEQVLIARHQGVPVGFITVGEPREDDAPTDPQLWALNLLPEHQGTGLADQMMTRALGEDAAYLWVAKGNDRAIRFYRRHGFVADGATSDRRDGMTEIRMVRGADAGRTSADAG